MSLLSFLGQHWVLATLLVVIMIALFIVELISQGAGGKGIDPQNAVNLINHESAAILDLRAKDIFKSGHIIEAINIPDDEVEKNLKKLNKHKNNPIILVTNDGQKFANVLALLTKNGFKNCKILAGGIKAWKEAGMPLEKIETTGEKNDRKK